MTAHGVSRGASAGTKKAAWLAATAGLVSARRGLDLACKPSWLASAQHLSGRWSPQYPVLNQSLLRHSLLRQNQFAQSRCAQLIRLAVVHDAHVTAALKQRIAAQHALRRFCCGRRCVVAVGCMAFRRRRRHRFGGTTGRQCRCRGAAQAKRGRACHVRHACRWCSSIR